MNIFSKVVSGVAAHNFIVASVEEIQDVIKMSDGHRNVVCLSFFLIWGDTRSLRMPALRSASQAGSMRNPREGTSVVLRDTIRLT